MSMAIQDIARKLNGSLIPIVLGTALSVTCSLIGWGLGVARGSAVQSEKIVEMQKKLDEHDIKIEKMRPADEMVSRDVYEQNQTQVHDDLVDIKKSIDELRNEMLRERRNR